MKSVKTINNQNAITDAILGLDDSSTTKINGNLIANASSASRINITDNNTASTFFIPFCSGVGSSTQLFIDSITGPLSYNASNGLLSCGSLYYKFIMSNKYAAIDNAMYQPMMQSVII